MKTKALLNNKLDKVSYNDCTVFTVPDYVVFLQKFPYRTVRYLNSFYYYLCQFLEPNTNRIVVFDGNGEAFPATIDILSVISEIPLKSFEVYMGSLSGDGVIGFWKAGGLKTYYMNPYFAVAGNKLSQHLIDLFKPNADEIYGEHLFSPDNQLYNDNRNKDYRFGVLKGGLLKKKHLSPDVKERISQELVKSTNKKRYRKDKKRAKRKFGEERVRKLNKESGK